MRGGPLTADAVVIGGGLHGCSAALHLARRRLRTVVLEKDHVGRHASGVNAGGVRRLGRALPEVPLADASLRLWQEIEALVGDDCGFVAAGQVKVAETAAELAALADRAARVRALGFDHEEIVGRDELRDLLPALAPHCVGAMVVRGDGYADPPRTVRAFRRRAAALGAAFLERTPVTGLARDAGVWRVTVPAGTIEAPVVVNCAGAWGGRVAALLGEPVPLEAHALMLMITARMPPFVGPVVGAQGRALSFKQFTNGTVLIGGGQQGRAVPEEGRADLDVAGLAASARTAAHLFPIMRAARIVRCWAGLEGVMPDGIPVIGPGAADGVVHAFGFSAHGFQLAPVVGAIVADLVTQGTTGLPIGAFAISRFAAAGPTPPGGRR